MTNIYMGSSERGETFTERQVSEISDAISKAVDEEMTRQYSALSTAEKCKR